MWIRVSRCDGQKQLVFGTLDGGVTGKLIRGIPVKRNSCDEFLRWLWSTG
jgi:hypothetical protein